MRTDVIPSCSTCCQLYSNCARQLDSSAGLKYFCKDKERNHHMSIRGKTAVVGIGETPTDRLGSKPGEPKKSTAEYLAWAARLAMEDAGLTKKDFDGQGLRGDLYDQSFTAVLARRSGGDSRHHAGRFARRRQRRRQFGIAARPRRGGDHRRALRSRAGHRRSGAVQRARRPSRRATRTPAITRCPSASWDPTAKFLSS